MHTIVAICEGTHMPFKIGACVKFFFTILTFVWENSRMIVSVTAVFLFQFNVLIQTSCGSKRKITIFTTKLGGVDFGFVVGFGLLEVGIGIALGGEMVTIFAVHEVYRPATGSREHQRSQKEKAVESQTP
jgi:hypothetical protein